MADEMRLPDELAAFEALLAAKPLAATGLDRDQVMYRAGWVACETKYNSPPSKGGARGGIPDRRHTAAWSCASAALAASLAVAVTLGLLRPERNEVETERAGGGTPRLAVDDAMAAVAADEQLAATPLAPAAMSDVERLINADARGGRATFAGPWLALHRLDRQSADDRGEDALTEVDATPAAPKTIRDLQQELLPLAPAPPRLVWPWERTTSGDSI